MTSPFVATLCTAIVCLCTFDVCAADPPVFKSQQFEKGALIYSDDFDEEYNRERWGAPKKDRQIKDGKLVSVDGVPITCIIQPLSRSHRVLARR